MTKADFSIDCVVAATDFSANGDMAVVRAAHIANEVVRPYIYYMSSILRYIPRINAVI